MVRETDAPWHSTTTFLPEERNARRGVADAEAADRPDAGTRTRLRQDRRLT
jgi:hypothetical protein